MPEIWVNYGVADVVLDIRAENLGSTIDSGGDTLDDSAVTEHISALEMAEPVDLVVLHASSAVQKTVRLLYQFCEEKSLAFPRLFADRHVRDAIKPALPEGSAIDIFDGDLPDSKMVFLAEMETSGLFGFETISTRLLRQFGQENMLNAYLKRRDDLPASGQHTGCADEARKFADGFEIQGIELVTNSRGIVDLAVGHPSKTAALSRSFESVAVQNAQRHKSAVVSTGKDASGCTLGRALNSIWSCTPAVIRGGMIALFAESRFGIGSKAVQRFIEGRLDPAQVRAPSKYLDGMEDLLFLESTKQRFEIGVISLLPNFYVKKLGMTPLNGTRDVLKYIFETRGAKQKIAVVRDGARVLLR